MSVQASLRPSPNEKTLQAMKAERTVKRITFDRNEAKPGETLYVSVPKLNEHEVIVPSSRFLVLTSTFRATQTTFLSKMFLERWLTNSL